MKNSLFGGIAACGVALMTASAQRVETSPVTPSWGSAVAASGRAPAAADFLRSSGHFKPAAPLVVSRATGAGGGMKGNRPTIGLPAGSLELDPHGTAMGLKAIEDPLLTSSEFASLVSLIRGATVRIETSAKLKKLIYAGYAMEALLFLALFAWTLRQSSRPRPTKAPADVPAIPANAEFS